LKQRIELNLFFSIFRGQKLIIGGGGSNMHIFSRKEGRRGLMQIERAYIPIATKLMEYV
jgi:hypothetical protein